MPEFEGDARDACTGEARYRHAEAFLYDRINYEKLRGSAKRYPFRLDHMRSLVRALGYADALANVDREAEISESVRLGTDSPLPKPQRPWLFHVGGTKGKGSVSTMIASILTAAGYRTGLYTSPHVETLRERFQIAGQSCCENDLIEMIDRLKAATESIETPNDPGKPQASFFELTTAGAYDLFRQRGCDAVVMEVGLGGRLDSTNVFQSDVSVITTIGLDHQAVLGDTHAQIAGEKAGIIKRAVPVVTGVTREDAWQVIRDRAHVQDCQVYQIDDQIRLETRPRDRWGSQVRVQFQPVGDPRDAPSKVDPASMVDPASRVDVSFELPLEGEHQARNASLAVAATAIMRDRAPEVESLFTSGSMTAAMNEVCPRGRLERYEIPIKGSPNEQVVLLDSAHNEDSVAALLAVVRRRHSGPVTFVFGTSVDKSSEKMVQQISASADQIIFTRFAGNPRWVDPAALAKQIPADHRCRVDVIADAEDAFEAAVEETRKSNIDEDRWIVICGSFFLAAELRPVLRNLLGESRHSG